MVCQQNVDGLTRWDTKMPANLFEQMIDFYTGLCVGAPIARDLNMHYPVPISPGDWMETLRLGRRGD